MDTTIFFTVLAGVLTYVMGQLISKLVIEPVQDARRTIGQISHALIERANVIHNPGVPSVEIMSETSRELRRLSSQLQSHLYLVPAYPVTATVFRLPSRAKLLAASSQLIGLSNSVYREADHVYDLNVKRVVKICDSLSIFLPEDERPAKG
jgi:hypothetical protein